MVWNLLFTQGQGSLGHGGGGLVGKKFMVGQVLKEFLEEKGKISTMDGRMHSKPFHPNWK